MEAAVVMMLHSFITGALLLASLGFMIVALVGFLGGFREVEPPGEDEPDVLQARRNPPRWPVEITAWPRRRRKAPANPRTLEEQWERVLREVAGDD